MRSDLRATRANRNDEDDHDDDDEDEDEDEDEVNEEEEEFGGANDDEYEVEQGTSLDDNDANDGDDGDDDDGQASSHAVSGEQRKSESNVARRRRWVGAWETWGWARNDFVVVNVGCYVF